MAIFTAWVGDNLSTFTLVPGDGPPRHSDGSLVPDCEELLWRIEADTWEDAMTRYHELQAWEPYRSMDDTTK